MATTLPAAAACRRFLALGDSYTIGEGVAADERWPAQLARRLRARGVAIDEPEIIARTGWSTDELAAAMNAAQFSPPYALVTLLIGVNNQYRGRDVTNYRDEFCALLDRAIALTGDAARVIVVSIPDWGVTGFAHAQARETAKVGAEIDAYNAAGRACSNERDVSFIDVTAISREAGATSTMLVEDGLHPSAAQYALWTHEILPAAELSLGLSPKQTRT